MFWSKIVNFLVKPVKMSNFSQKLCFDCQKVVRIWILVGNLKFVWSCKKLVPLSPRPKPFEANLCKINPFTLCNPLLLSPFTHTPCPLETPARNPADITCRRAVRFLFNKSKVRNCRNIPTSVQGQRRKFTEMYAPALP